MLNVFTMPLGAYQTNCYLLWEEGADSCVVIDPGYNPAEVEYRAKALDKKIQAILLTHGHFDHVGAVRQLAADTDCRVYLCAEDLAMPEQMTAGPLYYTQTYKDGDTLELAGTKLHIIHTPGQTPGSVCILCQDNLFSGDTLFAGSCGRTDLPGGNWATILQSLKRLAGFTKNYTVYPGHGESTTLEAEKKYNPYLKGLL